MSKPAAAVLSNGISRHVFASPRCYTEHAAIKADHARWSQLELVGRQVTPADETGPREVLELRNCPCCHSTLAVLVEVTP